MGSVVRSSTRSSRGAGRPGRPAGRSARVRAGRQAEGDHRLALVAAAQRVGRARGHDPAGGQDRHPVGQVLGLVHVVGGEQDRLAELAEALDQLPGTPPGRRVEPGGRLVQEEQVRVADQPEGQVEPSLLAARQRLDPGAGLLAQADQVDHLPGGARGRIVAAEQLQHLAHGELAEVAGGLEHDADPLAEVPPAPPRVEAEHLDLAGVAVPVPLEDLHGGRLAGPVRSQQREALPLGDLEVDAADGFQLAVALAQAGHADGRHRSSHPSSGVEPQGSLKPS